uniref:Uncharacterized protein n=1 Tax=Steinernema glaseri TaxID=37863 RepID=A0A1I8AVJ9_9BILA
MLCIDVVRPRHHYKREAKSAWLIPPFLMARVKTCTSTQASPSTTGEKKDNKKPNTSTDSSPTSAPAGSSSSSSSSPAPVSAARRLIRTIRQRRAAEQKKKEKLAQAAAMKKPKVRAGPSRTSVPRLRSQVPSQPRARDKNGRFIKQEPKSHPKPEWKP